MFCEFKGYKIYKVYREEGVSAKNTNRPKFKEMIQDMKDGKINKIIVYKLDRLTRSIQDLEIICTLLEEYNCDLESVAEAIRKCLRNAVSIESKYDMLKDIDSKLNRILYGENIQKKLLEQFYANMEFPVDKDVKTEPGLVRFYEKIIFITINHELILCRLMTLCLKIVIIYLSKLIKILKEGYI